MTLIFDDITELIGRTPLVRLNRLPGQNAASVLVKLEAHNPAGSVKDRVALAIIRAAEASGALQPGGTIVEATSGNTGIGLAAVGAALGYRVVITMPATMSAERRMLMRAYGAELVLTEENGVQGAVDAAAEIVACEPGAILASQFSNAANPDAHYRTTAREIWEDTGGAVDLFVAGIGTGGTLTGVGHRLRELKPGVQIVGIEPTDSPLLAGGKPGPHKIQGIGANFVPDVLDQDVWDELLHIGSEQAYQMARRAAREEGILAGISAGANLAGAVELAQRPENAGKTIVTVVPDGGERYLSTPLYAPYRK